MNTSLLKELIEALVTEKIRLLDKRTSRPFDIREFRTLANIHEVQAYLNNRLELLGEGSSRAAYLFSSNKVVKAAINDKGLAQNQAEIEMTTDPTYEGSALFTRIYDYDHGLNGQNESKWLISELVRELDDEKEFKKLTGVSFRTLMALLHVIDYDHNTSMEEALKKTSERLRGENKWVGADKGKWTELVNIDREFKIIQYSPMFITLFTAMKTKGLLAGDLRRINHWGKTREGRAVLLDYGFTEDTYRKHYSPGNW